MRRWEAWANAHSRLIAWVVLGIVLDAVVTWDSRSLRLGPARTGLLLLATTLAAGIAVWLVEWD